MLCKFLLIYLHVCTFHKFIPQIFMEFQLYPKCWAMLWGHNVVLVEGSVELIFGEGIQILAM